MPIFYEPTYFTSCPRHPRSCPILSLRQLSPSTAVSIYRQMSPSLSPSTPWVASTPISSCNIF